MDTLKNIAKESSGGETEDQKVMRQQETITKCRHESTCISIYIKWEWTKYPTQKEMWQTEFKKIN